MNEFDPNGLSTHDAGAKLDGGKLRASLVLGDFALALTEVCRVGTLGAEKYSPSGWLAVENGVARYSDAMLRHYLAEMSGEAMDRDLNVMHAAQVAWNALSRLELMLRGGK